MSAHPIAAAHADVDFAPPAAAHLQAPAPVVTHAHSLTQSILLARKLAQGGSETIVFAQLVELGNPKIEPLITPSQADAYHLGKGLHFGFLVRTADGDVAAVEMLAFDIRGPHLRHDRGGPDPIVLVMPSNSGAPTEFQVIGNVGLLRPDQIGRLLTGEQVLPPASDPPPPVPTSAVLRVSEEAMAATPQRGSSMPFSVQPVTLRKNEPPQLVEKAAAPAAAKPNPFSSIAIVGTNAGTWIPQAAVALDHVLPAASPLLASASDVYSDLAAVQSAAAPLAYSFMHLEPASLFNDAAATLTRELASLPSVSDPSSWRAWAITFAVIGADVLLLGYSWRDRQRERRGLAASGIPFERRLM